MTASSTSSTSNKRIAIVGGAGISGLQAIRSLKARGLQVVAYEGSNEIGGIWRKNYANVGVQVTRSLFEFPDMPMNNVPWEGYATGPQVHQYMKDYAATFKLTENIEFNTYVCSVKLQPDKSWLVKLKKNDNGVIKESVERFDYLIIASGLYSASNQFIPSIPGKESFKGQIMHSCEFYDASIAADKRVVVIGGGKSAVDIAVEAARNKARSVTLLPREMHWPSPRKILGIIPTHWVLMSRLGAAIASTQTGTFPSDIVPSSKSRVWSILTRPLYMLYEFLVAYQFDLKGILYPKTDVIRDFYNIHYSVNDDLTVMRRKGQVKLQMGEITQFKEDGSTLALKDGSTVSADLVVSATGFREDYSLFENPKELLCLEDDGTYMYRFMLPQRVPNIAFIGHVNAVSNICTYGLQAEWLARYLAGDLVNGPTPEKMKKDIENRKAWAQGFMPASKVRGMTILLHQGHYWDLLLKDMGINPYRKRNIFAEYLVVYGPSDYNGIIGMPAPKKVASRPWTWY